MVRSPDGETDFFQIISGVLQGDTFIHSFMYLTHTFLQKQRAVAIRATFL